MIFSHLDKEIFEIFLQEFCKHLNLQEKPKNQETWLVVDRASWHSIEGMTLPVNLKIKVFPTAAAQINPIERLWLHIRKYFMSCKVHKNLEKLEETLLTALQAISKVPETLMSICKVHMIKKNI